MLDPYRMVFVNVIALTLVLGSAFLYRFVYPRRKINLFILLILISILPIISVLRIGDYESGDFNIHVRRAMEFYNMLSQGNFIPTWAGDLNATYGYPLFAFDYILPYYILSLFHFLGLSFIASLKLFLAINFILSGVFMYLFSKNHFKNTLAAFASSIFFLFTPYHLIAIHFKITIGEILSYTLIPLFFYFLFKFTNKKRIVYILLSGLLLGLIILSHIVIAIFLIPAIFVYVFLVTKQITKTVSYSFKIVAISLLVSAFQWTASLIYYPYLYATTHNPASYPYFPSISDLLYSPWRFGLLFQGSQGEISSLLGYAQILTILSIMYYLIKKKVSGKHRQTIISWLTLLFLSIFFITPYSFPIWKHLSFLSQIGSQRLLITVAFYISLLMGYLTLIAKNKVWLIYALIFLAIGTTILNWGHRRVIPTINDSILRSNISLGTTWADSHIYALPKWVNSKQMWFSNIPNSHTDILQGQARIKSLKRTSTFHEYEINATTSLKLRENTLYFPGWTATLNKKNVFLKPDNNGVIILDVPKGKWNLKITYEDLFLFRLAKEVSIISSILIVFYSLFYFSNKKLKLNPKSLNKD